MEKGDEIIIVSTDKDFIQLIKAMHKLDEAFDDITSEFTHKYGHDSLSAFAGMI